MRFSLEDTQKLLEIMKARRDVRGNRFIDKKVEDEKLSLILEAALLAPSVGYSQPWKFIVIEDAQTKDAILQNFNGENEKAKELFASRELYQKLKLEGIKEAPINIGIGWVSILDEEKVLQTLEAPKNAKLIAYLCVGYVDKFYEESELKPLGWEQEKQLTQCVTYRR